MIRNINRSIHYMAWMVLFILMVMATSCEEESGVTQDASDLTGTWVKNRYQDYLTILSRQEDLQKDQYGFVLQPGGKFIERKNSGPCATPPISYKNYEGTWEMLSDSLVKIRVGYWGGMMRYDMKIFQLEGDTLRIQYHYYEE